MVLGAILTIAAIIGIINGVKKKIKALVIASAIVLIAVVALGLYIYNNPY